MSSNEEQGFQLNDLARRMANLIRVGTVAEIDYENARAKVKIGDLETAFLPWITEEAGENVNWKAVQIGEQVVVLSPNGELDAGIILKSLYQSSATAPSNFENIQKKVFKDGSVVEYDTENKFFKCDLKGDADIKIAGKVNIEASTAIVKAPVITLDGNTTVNGNLSGVGNVALGGGGVGVARIGDAVEVDPITHKGTITAGSSKVKSG